MRRRNYLGALAVAAVAGCLDAEPAEEAPAEESEPEPEPESEPADDPEAEPESEFEPDEDSELSESEQRAQQRIEEADALLGEALSVYAEINGAESFLDVRGSRTEIRWAPVANRIRAANDLLDRIEWRANDTQQRRINRLRRLGSMIRESARTQQSLGIAFRIFGDVVIAHQGDTVSPVAWRRFRAQLSDLTDRLNGVETAGQPSDAEASEHITPEAYAEKVTQLETESDALQRVLAARESFVAGHTNWIRGARNYQNEAWSSAASRLSLTATNFDDALTELGDDTVGDDRFDRRLQTFNRIAGALSEAAVEYSESAAAYDRRDTEEGDARRRAGRRILRNEDAIDTMPSVLRLELFVP